MAFGLEQLGELSRAVRPNFTAPPDRFLNHLAGKFVQVRPWGLGSGIAVQGGNIIGMWLVSVVDGRKHPQRRFQC